MASSRLQAVIFDMDGVLIDNSAYYASAWEQFLGEHRGLIQPDYPARQTFGRRNSDLFPEVFGRAIPEAELRSLGNRLEAIYLERFLPVMAPMPGLLPLLDRLLRAGTPMAVASSAPEGNVRLVMERLGLGRYFKTTLCELDVTRGKPDPQIYQRAAARLDCAPEVCLVFEDALVGIAAARAAGMACIALASTYPESALKEAGAEFVIRDFEDARVVEVLGRFSAVTAGQ